MARFRWLHISADSVLYAFVGRKHSERYGRDEVIYGDDSGNRSPV